MRSPGAEPDLTNVSARRLPRWARSVATLLWGAVLATWLTWRYFTYPPGFMHPNHEGFSYVLRLIEFVDCLRAGQLFPQWASDFRAGLGAPYFVYYQPGIFYVASVFTPFLSMTAAIGAALWLLTYLGFLATVALVGRRFGGAAGLLAGSALVLGPYPSAEIYIRGDLSEYAGMMVLPAALHAVVTCFEAARPHTWSALALSSAALVVLHPVVGLVGYGVLAAAILWYAVATRTWGRGTRAVGALLLGVGLTAFYWLPVALEWSWVSGDIMAAGAFHYSRHFIEARQLLGGAGPHRAVDVSLGPVVPALAILGTAMTLARPGARAPSRRRLAIVLGVVTVIAVFLMTAPSEPVWATVPLLHRAQFPWRLLVVVTVATAMLAGCQPAWPRPIAAVGIVALLALAVAFEPEPAVPYARPMHRGQDLRAIHFAPDAVGEWLPNGARAYDQSKDGKPKPRRFVTRRLRVNPGIRTEPIVAVPREARCTPPCESLSLARGQGWLRVRLTSEHGASLLLPHYFFSGGWETTLDGMPIAMGRNEDGLMQFVVPPVHDGVLEARFRGTPMRRRGIIVSAAALTLWAAALAVALRRAARPA
jgi:hypothetical protein